MIGMEMERAVHAPVAAPGRTRRSVGLLAGGVLTLAVAWAYHLTMERARVVSAVSELDAIASLVDDFHARHGRYPESLAEVDADERLDPWGHPYGYARSAATYVAPASSGASLNVDYDLWSVGPDGRHSAASRAGDDIVRAREGAFVGPLGEL